jgi:hypothetical protein
MINVLFHGVFNVRVSDTDWPCSVVLNVARCLLMMSMRRFVEERF